MITDQQLIDLKKSLIFLHVGELKDLAIKLSLLDKGNKMTIIMRILYFLQTGQKLTMLKFPEKSCAKRGQNYPLDRAELMLKGSYKNDLETRIFFKRIIGNHFHFTAFGIDWLNNRWMEENPPTYDEFAKMWQEEYEKRLKIPASPKQEWAYIKFVKLCLIESPEATRDSINKAWECEREKHKANVFAFMEQKLSSSAHFFSDCSSINQKV